MQFIHYNELVVSDVNRLTIWKVMVNYPGIP